MFAFDGKPGPRSLQPGNEPGKCLAVNGPIVDVSDCKDGDPAQKFNLDGDGTAVTPASSTRASIISNSIATKYSTANSTNANPITAKSTIGRPTIEGPVTGKPVTTEKPITKPINEKPRITEKPVTEKPINDKPTSTEKPVTQTLLTAITTIATKSKCHGGRDGVLHADTKNMIVTSAPTATITSSVPVSSVTTLVRVCQDCCFQR